MQIKSYFAILIGLSAIFSCRTDPHWRQMPRPDLTSLKDDVGSLPLSDSYIPATMQAIHYFSEMMQYELLPNTASDQSAQTTTRKPVVTTTKKRTTTRATTKPTTTRLSTRPTTTRPTTRPTTRTTTTSRTTQKTTRKPTTQQDSSQFTTEINIWHNPPTTPRPHKPGNYAPDKPPYWTYFGIPMKPEQGFHKPGVQQPQEGINALSDPDWNNPAFQQWFFQPRPREIEPFDENELQYLDPLPKKLLIDIHRESNRLPALLDLDNVNEFRKKYDDSFYPRYRNNVPDMQHMRMRMRIQMMQQHRQTLTGRKKPPPTRAYVPIVVLYDNLKARAKELKLHMFGGFTSELLKELHDSSLYTGDYQMKYLLEKIVEKREIVAADIVMRIKSIISDLNDEKSVTLKTFRSIPPLVFLP